MSLSKAIRKRDMKLLIETVEEAVAIYGSSKPEEILVDTVHGSLPFSSIWDKKTRWQIIEVAYADIIQKASRIRSSDDKKIEIAKLIANNPILRNLNTDVKTEGLL